MRGHKTSDLACNKRWVRTGFTLEGKRRLHETKLVLEENGGDSSKVF